MYSVVLFYEILIAEEHIAMYVLQLLKPGPNLYVPIPGTIVSGGRLEPRAQVTQKSPAMAS